MGASVNGVGDGNTSTENGNPDDIGASDPVVYQLVRVNGDGTLIPATDDELIEFEHFGTRQSDNAEVDSKEVVCKDELSSQEPQDAERVSKGRDDILSFVLGNEHPERVRAGGKFSTIKCYFKNDKRSRSERRPSVRIEEVEAVLQERLSQQQAEVEATFQEKLDQQQEVHQAEICTLKKQMDELMRMFSVAAGTSNPTLSSSEIVVAPASSPLQHHSPPHESFHHSPEDILQGNEDDIAQDDALDHPSQDIIQESMDVNGPLFMQPKLSDTHDKGQSSEACSETGKKEAKEVGEGAASETYSSSTPDFSLLKGEICLDSFSIRELQEAFRATFGRYTSIKDKLWLKRRIAMGLTNSCDVPSTNFFIKDNKIVFNNLKEETQSRTLSNLPNSGIITINKATAILKETLEETLANAADQVEEMQVLYIKGGEKSLDRYNEDKVNNQSVQCGIKRIRKPTKRYIEELSEVEATECRGRLASLDKISVQDQLIFKSRIKRTCMVDTHQDLLGGYDARIPFVHRGRRRRPRKDFLALMNFVQMEGEKQIPEVLNSEQLSSQEHDNYISSQDDLIDENHDPVQTMVPSVRRKHHRAWTLAEVLKLVEGVSMYGAGKWSEIRRLAFASGSHRTSVDLKDKWRNLLKASFSQAPTDKGVSSSRKPTSLPIPTPILQRVRELAKKHSHSHSQSQSGLEFGSSQFTSNPGIVQEKETGFL